MYTFLVSYLSKHCTPFYYSLYLPSEKFIDLTVFHSCWILWNFFSLLWFILFAYYYVHPTIVLFSSHIFRRPSHTNSNQAWIKRLIDSFYLIVLCSLLCVICWRLFLIDAFWSLGIFQHLSILFVNSLIINNKKLTILKIHLEVFWAKLIPPLWCWTLKYKFNYMQIQLPIKCSVPHNCTRWRSNLILKNFGYSEIYEGEVFWSSNRSQKHL